MSTVEKWNIRNTKSATPYQRVFSLYKLQALLEEKVANGLIALASWAYHHLIRTINKYQISDKNQENGETSKIGLKTKIEATVKVRVRAKRSMSTIMLDDFWASPVEFSRLSSFLTSESFQIFLKISPLNPENRPEHSESISYPLSSVFFSISPFLSQF